VGTAKQLPFESYCMFVDSVALTGDMRDSSNVKRYETPVAKGRVGAKKDAFSLEFSTTMRGQIRATVRMDK
jgi:hypothetical protein